MKTFKYIVYLLVATFVFAGCSDDPTYIPGGAEDPDSQAVYFPSQENAADLELDPADPTVITLTAMRQKDQEAIVVPVTVNSTPEGVFTASPIEFAAGQTETTFTVSFPDAEIGKLNTCNIQISDPKYALIYGANAISVGFSITRVKWNKVVGEGGEQLGKWRDDILSSAFGLPVPYAEGDVEIYERADKKGYYRIQNVYSAEYLAKILDDTPSGVAGNRIDATTIIDATDPNKVWLPIQTTGVTLGSDGMVGFLSDVSENVSNSGDSYGTLENGVITFPVKGLLITFTGAAHAGKFYIGNGSGMMRIMLPGAKTYDYVLSLSKSEPVNGKVLIGATLGADVDKVKYAFFEGALNPTLAAAKSGDIDAGTIPADQIKEIAVSGEITVEMEQTGVYSIVANAYNAAGELTGYKSLSFGYIVAGDSKPVILTSGLIVSNKHAASGFTAEDSVEAYAVGEGIESGYYGVFDSGSLAGVSNLATLVMSSGRAFKPEDIEAINGMTDEPFSVVVGGLNGGTDYTLVVLAYNGYVSTVFTSEATTEGTPHPLKRNYTLDDITGPITKDALFKSWNLWAVDYYDEGNSKRQKLGTMTFSENTAKDVTTGTPLDAINVAGLTLGESESDVVVWEYYNGLIYALMGGQPMGSVVLNGATYYLGYLLLDAATGMGSAGMDNMIAGGLVADGYMAFVDSGLYDDDQTDYNFNGVAIKAFTDQALTASAGNILLYYDIMCEDPAVATSSVAPKITRTQLRSLVQTAMTPPKNFVELRGRERIHALIDEMQSRPKTRKAVMSNDILRVEAPELGVAKAKTSFSEGIARPAVSKSGLKRIATEKRIEVR